MSAKAETIRSILGSETNDKSVHAQAIHEVLKTAADDDERAELFAVVLTERDSVTKKPKPLSNKGLSSEEWAELNSTQQQVVMSYLLRTFLRTTTAVEFAKDALRVLDLFDTDNEMTFAIAAIMFSPYVPYRVLPGRITPMSSERFDHLAKANKDQIELISYAINIPFNKTTEVASLLLPILDMEQDQETRVALLAAVIGVHQRKFSK
ncbi:MAG: hypothetical protein KAY24_04205 [Candidatus Eisenbacteria sp.]|nr:hypothetical protein [Candidatus Eisenbacteria bacterium]